MFRGTTPCEAVQRGSTRGLQLFMAVALVGAMSDGCMVGPDYHRPAVQTPAAFRDLGDKHKCPTKRPPTRTFAGGKYSRTPNCRN